MRSSGNPRGGSPPARTPPSPPPRTAPGAAAPDRTPSRTFPPPPGRRPPPRAPPPVTVPTLVGFRQFAAGADAGGAPLATLFNPDGSPRYTATAFGGGFTGGVRTAAADFNGDGVADLVVGSGPGGPSHV